MRRMQSGMQKAGAVCAFALVFLLAMQMAAAAPAAYSAESGDAAASGNAAASCDAAASGDAAKSGDTAESGNASEVCDTVQSGGAAASGDAAESGDAQGAAASSVSVLILNLSGETILNTVSVSSSAASSVIYSDDSVTVSVTVSEADLNADETQILVTCTDEQGEEVTVSAEVFTEDGTITWTQNGDGTVTAELIIEEEGAYSISVISAGEVLVETQEEETQDENAQTEEKEETGVTQNAKTDETEAVQIAQTEEAETAQNTQTEETEAAQNTQAEETETAQNTQAEETETAQNTQTDETNQEEDSETKSSSESDPEDKSASADASDPDEESASAAETTAASTYLLIDRTAPFVSIGGVQDHSANNGEVCLTVTYTDENYIPCTAEDTEALSVTLTGTKSSACMPQISSIRQLENGMQITYCDFPMTEDADDIYTLTVAVTDQAGNVGTDEIMFSVNRFGSVYLLSDDTKFLVESGYTNEAQDIVVTEINCCELVSCSVNMITADGIAELIPDEDYTAEKNGTEDSWFAYQYTIFRENFSEEGSYQIVISSEDAAGNSMDNRSRGGSDAQIGFTIDRTAPQVRISGVSDGGTYQDPDTQAVIIAEDNMAVASVTLLIDDEEAALTDNGDGTWSCGIRSSDQWQNLKAYAADAAGNISAVQEACVMVRTAQEDGTGGLLQLILCAVLFSSCSCIKAIRTRKIRR